MTSLLPGNYCLTRALLVAISCYCLMLPGLTLAQTTGSDEPPPAATETTEQPAPADASSAGTEVKAPEEPALYQSREERDMTLLANSQSGESVVWLEAMGVPFLSLYEQDLSGNPVGAILILNAEEQHSNWPDVIEPLRMSLPEFGWSSLSTQLPTPAAATIPERSLPPLGAAPNAAEESSSEDDVDGGEATAKAEEQTLSLNKTETEDPPAAAMPKENNTGSEKREDQPEDTQLPVEEVALQRLQASINFLHSKGQFNIVLLGNGIGATRAACFISSEVNSDTAPQNRLVRALVLVNARNQIRGSDMQLHHCLTTPKTPVLDVYTGLSQRDRLEAKQRLKSSNRNNYRVYQQIHLPEVAHNSMLGENRLTRRIRGFLESHARGVKVDNAVIVDR